MVRAPLDETYIKIKGKWHCCIDHPSDGFNLGYLVT